MSWHEPRPDVLAVAGDDCCFFLSEESLPAYLG